MSLSTTTVETNHSPIVNPFSTAFVVFEQYNCDKIQVNWILFSCSLVDEENRFRFVLLILCQTRTEKQNKNSNAFDELKTIHRRIHQRGQSFKDLDHYGRQTIANYLFCLFVSSKRLY